jgi:hypothetical protein
MAGQPEPHPARAPVRGWSRALAWWYGLVGAGGFAFGLLGERRPFGADVIAHPLVVFAIAVGVALLVVRVALMRPVPEVIPDRALLLGCAVGLALFLAGNFVATRWLAGVP